MNVLGLIIVVVAPLIVMGIYNSWRLGRAERAERERIAEEYSRLKKGMRPRGSAPSGRATPRMVPARSSDSEWSPPRTENALGTLIAQLEQDLGAFQLGPYNPGRLFVMDHYGRIDVAPGVDRNTNGSALELVAEVNDRLWDSPIYAGSIKYDYPQGSSSSTRMDPQYHKAIVKRLRQVISGMRRA